MFPFIAASAVVPSLLLIWYFHARDLNKEPARVLWATFGLGVATVIPVLIVAMPLSKVTALVGDPASRGAAEALLTAALPEEFFKYLVVVFYCSRHKEFDEPMDGIVYGAVASLGFATLENILYVAQGGLGLAIVRAITAVPGHAFMGAIMGSFVARARFGAPEDRARNLTLAYFVPMTLHALYDAPLLAMKHVHKPSPLLAASVLVTLGVLVFEWLWTVRLVRRMHAEQVSIASRVIVAAVVTPEVTAVAAEVQEVITPAPRPPRRSVLQISGIVFGTILSSLGGLVTLALALALIVERHAPRNVGATIVGGAIIGLVPLALGLWLFHLGLRRRPA